MHEKIRGATARISPTVPQDVDTSDDRSKATEASTLGHIRISVFFSTARDFVTGAQEKPFKPWHSRLLYIANVYFGGIWGVGHFPQAVTEIKESKMGMRVE
jgi:hypothetical protein